ncbi:glucosaminidase domain-containing protein [Lentzea terrae]|uniref:glucosaminidase domain-containing protein n=1 Tax=Lentzea terrae TaxID=2200761 RepID=UPI000DD457AF|nr:glucosaminidase domain-containing protein [Lentzea terrae]
MKFPGRAGLIGIVIAAALSTLTPSAQAADYWATAEPRARAVKAEYDIPASVAAAQAAHESARGTSRLAAEFNNHFGMKCVSATNPGPIAVGCRSLATEECQPTCQPTTAYFRVYATMTDSFRDYGRVLTTSSNYAHALPHRHDPREFIRQVAQRYATDPNYANKIIAMMDANNLYRYDVGGATPHAPMYHQIRNADGTWTGFRSLAGYQTTLPGNAKDVAVAAMADGTAQVVVVGADDVVYHQIRYPDRWTGFQPLAGNGTTAPAKAKRVSIAGMADGTAQVVIVGWDDRVYHQIRHPDRWTGFQPVAGQGTTTPAVGKDVSIAAMPDGSAQLVVVGADDVVYHEIRYPDRWTGFQPLAGNGTTAPAKGKRVAVAGMADGRSQVVIVGWDDRVYHQVRAADGSWSGFQPLNGAGTTLPAAGKDVAIGTHPDGTAQVLIIGSDDGIYHRIRTSNAWTEFQTVAGTDGTPAKGSGVAISGHDDNSAQVVIMGR